MVTATIVTSRSVASAMRARICEPRCAIVSTSAGSGVTAAGVTGLRPGRCAAHPRATGRTRSTRASIQVTAAWRPRSLRARHEKQSGSDAVQRTASGSCSVAVAPDLGQRRSHPGSQVECRLAAGRWSRAASARSAAPAGPGRPSRTRRLRARCRGPAPTGSGRLPARTSPRRSPAAHPIRARASRRARHRSRRRRGSRSAAAPLRSRRCAPRAPHRAPPSPLRRPAAPACWPGSGHDHDTVAVDLVEPGPRRGRDVAPSRFESVRRFEDRQVPVRTIGETSPDDAPGGGATDDGCVGHRRSLQEGRDVEVVIAVEQRVVLVVVGIGEHVGDDAATGLGGEPARMPARCDARTTSRRPSVRSLPRPP